MQAAKGWVVGDKTIRVLCVGVDAPQAPDETWGPFAYEGVADLQQVAAHAGGAGAVLIGADALPAQPEPATWAQAAGDCAWLVVAADPAPELVLRCLQLGAHDVVSPDELVLPGWPRRLRAAVEHRSREREMNHAHATDLATGLPNRRQLVEHTAQLLALRERESVPLPVNLVVLRLDGLGAVEAAHGAASAQVVRRKLAVRLRASVRASDVVASLGADAFALLLPSAESPEGAEFVVGKLRRAMREPVAVAGSTVGVVAHIGLAQHPRDGDDAEALLRRAAAEALAAADAPPRGAAND